MASYLPRYRYRMYDMLCDDVIEVIYRGKLKRPRLDTIQSVKKVASPIASSLSSR